MNMSTQNLKNIGHHVLIGLKEMICKGMATQEQVNLYNWLISLSERDRNQVCQEVYFLGKQMHLN
ncbi:MAG: hypothetical protein IJ772_04545 [Bacilli bacterium]|nr:hypothetical protein [Bacilli bacterium]